MGTLLNLVLDIAFCLSCRHLALTATLSLALLRGSLVLCCPSWYSNRLNEASNRGRKAVVRLLVDKGANVNA
jgi:hypothetical protein